MTANLNDLSVGQATAHTSDLTGLGMKKLCHNHNNALGGGLDGGLKGEGSRIC